MLKLLPDYLKTKKICIRAVKKLLFVMRYVSDWYKTQQMCDKVIVENDGTLGLFLIIARAKKCVITLFVIILMH